MIRIFNEDCLEGMKKIPDGSVDSFGRDNGERQYGRSVYEYRQKIYRL